MKILSIKKKRTARNKFNHLCAIVRKHLTQQKDIIPKLWPYMLDVAYERLTEDHEDRQLHKDTPIGAARTSNDTPGTLPFKSVC